MYMICKGSIVEDVNVYNLIEKQIFVEERTENMFEVNEIQYEKPTNGEENIRGLGCLLLP